MPDYSGLGIDELKAELEKNKSYLVDAQDERVFLGKQQGQHIKVSEFEQLDKDVEKFEKRIATLESLIEQKS